MFSSFFGDLFGPVQSSRSETQIVQLYKLHATFRFATRELLDGDVKSNDGLGSQINARSMELYYLMDSTHVVMEYEDRGLSGGYETPQKVKINQSTSNTMSAIFALLNNDKEEFDRLVKEGPTPKELAAFEKKKQDCIDARKKYLDKIANCDHTFGSGFYQSNTCTKCKIKKEKLNEKPNNSEEKPDKEK